ncbi:MAG: DUF2314 domain-containing protein [Mariniblastus sp.]
MKRYFAFSNIKKPKLTPNVLAFAIFSISLGVAIYIFPYTTPMIVSAVICAFLYLAYLIIRNPLNEISPGPQMVSMVALFRQLPKLDRHLIEQHVKKSWNLDFKNNEDSSEFVKGSAPMFLISTEDRIYTVNYFDRPYFDNPNDILNYTSELRIKSIVRSHQAWISVDLMKPGESLDNLDREYALIGKLINHLASGQAIAILIPETMRVIPWSKATQRMLESDAPLSVQVEDAPAVLQVDDRDPRLRRAVLKARKRFPQFVEAFERSMRGEVPAGELQDFSIKSPVTVGENTEYIWSKVTAIENGIAYATLCNEPISLDGASAGDRVRIHVDQLNDWIYKDKDEIVGGFTIAVLKKLRQRKQT